MPDLAAASGRFEQAAHQLYEWLDRARGRRGPFIIFAAALFLAGVLWSATSLDLSAAQFRLVPSLLLFAVVSPLGLLYGAVGLMILARTAHQRIGLGSAWRTAGYAQLAEALPLPGGAIVRTAALHRAGAGPVRSLALVGTTAVLWISLAACGAAFALFAHQPQLAAVLAGIGVTASAAVLGWIVRQAGIRVAAILFGHRLIGLALMAARMLLAFAVLGAVLDVQTSFYFAFANIAGSATAFAPAGLGVGEAIAAAMSGLVAIDPALAFLAVATNRVISIASCAATVALTQILTGSGRADPMETV